MGSDEAEEMDDLWPRRGGFLREVEVNEEEAVDDEEEAGGGDAFFFPSN